MLKRDAGGLLLRFFLGSAFGAAERLGEGLAFADANLDAEATAVIGPALFGEDVAGLAGSAGLEELLQSGLVVADGSAERAAGLESVVKGGERWLDDVAGDEGLGGGHAGVEIKGGDDRLDGVSEEGGFLAAAAGLFSATETEQGAELHAGGGFGEGSATDERGAETGEFALAGGGEAADEVLRGDEAKDGVAEEFKLLVVVGGIVRGAGGGFKGVGAVGERELKEAGVAKAVAKQVLDLAG